MFIKPARKHPQGTPFTDIMLVLCTQCGEHEMEMQHTTSRAMNNDNNQPTYDVGNTCWDCLFKD